MAIGNNDDEPVTVHAPTVTESSDVPPHPVGSIVELEHHTDLDVAAGASTAVLGLPLPAAFGAQVPLDLHAWLEPADAGELELVRDGAVNVGLVARFAPRDAPARVSVSWIGVVLVRGVLPDERANMAELASAHEDWLAPTAAVDANAREAHDVIMAAHGDHGAHAAALRDWLAALELPAEAAESNQSTHVLASGRRANCTGTPTWRRRSAARSESRPGTSPAS